MSNLLPMAWSHHHHATGALWLLAVLAAASPITAATTATTTTTTTATTMVASPTLTYHSTLVQDPAYDFRDTTPPIQDGNGTWHLYCTRIPIHAPGAPSGYPGRVAHFSAPNITGPWTFGSIVVDVTPGAWDSHGVFTPGVIYDADVDTWFLFYGGVGSHYQNHTGLSFSEWQGLASSRSPYGPFAKYANNPIIRSPAGPPTAALADDPLSGCRPCSPMLSTRLTGGRVLAQVHLLAPDFRLCAGACCRESNCSAWSYDGTAGPQGRCVLLAADATQPPLEPVPAAGAVAGFQLTPSPCQPSSEPPQVGINISGEDMGHLLIPRNDSSLCAAACCASGACVAYTFTWSQPNAAENCPKGSNCCWLKSGYAATNPEANVVSGRVTRAAAATCPQLNSTVLRGGRQLQQMALPRADPLLCETACLDLMPCTGFSYTPQQAQATAACPQGSPCCTLQGMQSTPEPQAGTVSRNMFDRFVLWDQTWIRADNPRPIYLDGPSGGSSNSGSSSGSTRNPGPRRVLSMKTVQLDMSALMDHFVPSGPSWFGTYSTLPYNPVVRPTKLDAKGFENQEYFNTPHDPFWHMIGNSHGSAGQPHMVSTDVTGGGNWTIVEVIQNLGEPAPVARGLPSPHQPPPEYFVRFDGNPLSIHLYTIEWRMVPLPQPPCS